MGFISNRWRIVLLLLLLRTVSLSAQNEKSPLFVEKGGLVGAGYGVNSLSLPEGKYIPVFFMAHFGIDILKKGTIPHRQKFLLFFEPQVNAVVLQHPGPNGKAAEFGLNVGVQHMLPLSRNFYVYALISSGPQFITVHTERQAHGFIFSDNMGAGTYYFFGKNLALNTGFRIRHMSNANTRMPNHGINTVNFLMGVSYFLR
jgi:hypothetical protein